jgi:hypothetical protein
MPVLPVPQKVTLAIMTSASVRTGDYLGPGIPPDDVAVDRLKSELQSRFRLNFVRQLGNRGSSGELHLNIAPNSVTIGRPYQLRPWQYRNAKHLSKPTLAYWPGARFSA